MVETKPKISLAQENTPRQEILTEAGGYYLSE